MCIRDSDSRSVEREAKARRLKAPTTLPENTPRNLTQETAFSEQIVPGLRLLEAAARQVPTSSLTSSQVTCPISLRACYVLSYRMVLCDVRYCAVGPLYGVRTNQAYGGTRRA
eukprot:2936007-Rhodomonas_salina.1